MVFVEACVMELPDCPKCGKKMVPISIPLTFKDTPLLYGMWKCVNSECGYKVA